MRIANVLAMASPLILAAGCSSPYQDTSYGTYPAYTSPALTASETDRALEASLRSQLHHYGDLNASASNVQIYSQNGTVTLTGYVPSERDKQMIDSLVRSTAGVVAVNDQLQVTYPPTGVYTGPTQVYSRPPAPVVTPNPAPVFPAGPNLTVQATTDTDRAIAQGISDRLRAEATLTSLFPGVNINVTDGRAYVRGSVTSEEQRRTIISAVRNTPGVTAVYDELMLR